MNHKWIWTLVILMFCQNFPTGVCKDVNVVEGEPVEIKCNSGQGSVIVWFRVLDSSGMEFLASYLYSGALKTPSPSFSEIFNSKTSNQNKLNLNAFNKKRDSGIYSCGSLIKGNELKFGEVTRLIEAQKTPKTESTTKAALELTDKPKPFVTSAPCMCTDTGSSVTFLSCDLRVLIPLVSGCGFLLLLLVITILYCNRIRTRRCPHHYKRQRGTAAPVKQMNRPV
ncbi:T-cell surface glycoprotein CD8 alpha chain [Gouania willdenowi]|uniref:T-cell surface glycoprotein CD8 alpha chain n=1 Tax=Gouania willdenowi TaxID=441366 RepID=UPI001054A05F|nr:T-cell surface glycoprotein CD8 alpha chain-like [Gouania willdenowi]